jgi:hypothetical protein
VEETLGLEQWKAIEAELNSLKKRKVVFMEVISTSPRTFPIFVRKRNENNEMVRYKAMLVVQGFTQT